MTIANKSSIHQHLLTIDGMNPRALWKSRASVCMLFGENIFYFTLDKKRIVDNTVEKFLETRYKVLEVVAAKIEPLLAKLNILAERG
jgi:hypothetical protein